MTHETNWKEYGEKTSSDANVQKSPDMVHDEIYGAYKDEIAETPVDARLPTANLPKGKDPQPFGA